MEDLGLLALHALHAEVVVDLLEASLELGLALLGKLGLPFLGPLGQVILPTGFLGRHGLQKLRFETSPHLDQAMVDGLLTVFWKALEGVKCVGFPFPIFEGLQALPRPLEGKGQDFMVEVLPEVVLGSQFGMKDHHGLSAGG